jgi:hypothetical protein
MFRRWLIFGLALMLLTLCLAAWGASHWRRIHAFHDGKTFLLLVLDSGRVLIGWASAPGIVPEWYSSIKEAGSWDGWDQRTKFSWLGFSYDGDVHSSYFTIPLWFLSLLSLFLVWFAWRKARPKEKGKAFPIEPSFEAKSQH